MSVPATAFRSDALSGAFTDWMRTCRWFRATASDPVLTRIGVWVLPDPKHQVAIEVQLVHDATTDVLYQVPLTARTSPLLGGDDALVEQTPDGVSVYDGPHDPAFARALLMMILTEGRTDAAAADAPVPSDGVTSAAGHHGHVDTAVRVVGSHVLRGEQSNTSIIVETVHPNGKPATPIICKVFRALSPGDNPDVVIQSALSDAGSRFVPRTIGHVEGAWADPATASRVEGSLAFAQEFIPDVEDAWRVALRAAEHGESFRDAATALGEATAAIHVELSRLFDTRPASPADVDGVLTSMRTRAAQAFADAPVLADERGAVEAVQHAAGEAAWPELQRIHGDYHLGQVLAVPGRGWVVLDFEGEPLRPIAERSEPDLALRDVAGMLRSFDYVAGSISSAENATAEQSAAARAWADEARAAFLEGYAARSGVHLAGQQLLLDALELDKALYEVSYEAQNRPTWLPIPATAVRTLAHRAR
ncbi:phosphotransferase [Cnuibacter sp. UC19_7]|uniref:maltokinase N-terminal cap-like domain-containing protein n=1 Tax=Cnuibacter sp. UC19_7 TaxID=3350166 RepID=UPI00366D2CA0